MARKCCPLCHYPEASCVCEYLLSPINNHTHVWIARHPHEQTQAKSTVPLMLLALENITVVHGEQPEDFSSIQALPKAHTRLLYPSENAQAVEQVGSNADIRHLVVLDGTWSKVHKLMQLNPWLADFECVSFESTPSNQYHLRKANRENSLSTLEATAHCLQHLEALDTSPLHTLLAGFIEKQTAHMPESVKQRYLKC